jgi:subtilisin family serine protease
VATTATAAGAPEPDPRKPGAEERELIASAEREGPQSVIVEFADTSDVAPMLDRMSKAGTGFDVTRDYEVFPFAALTADAESLRELTTSPDVVGVYVNKTGDLALDETTELINAGDVHQRGITGEGQMVVVLDSGVDTEHEFFGERVTEEACFSSGDGTGTSVCPNGETEQFGPGAADPLTDECGAEDCSHGTHVAGIAAGAAAGAAPSDGVAPGAEIGAVQIVTRDCEGCNGIGWTYADVIKGIEHALVLNDEPDIDVAAVNMSLGVGLHSEFCGTGDDTTDPDVVLRAAITRLVDAGIAPVAASGNLFDDDEISSPACIQESVAVGATDDDDMPADFGNRNDLLDLFAPGVEVESSLADDTHADYGSLDGTSMAAPHVAGAFALLRQADPDSSVAELLTRLQETGVPITHDSGGRDVTTPRIDLAAAVPEASGLTYTGPTSAAVGQTFTASATLTASGDPVSGATVSFSLGSGGDSQECSGTTNGSGEASCSLTPTDAPGETTLTASFAGNGDVAPSSDTVPFTIGRQPTVVTYTGPTEADFHDVFTASATLTAGGSPVSGQTVSFSLGSGGGSQECSGTTNGSGEASCSMTPTDEPGQTTIDVSFAGTGTLEPSSDSASFTITRQETALRYTGPERVANGTAVELSGVLTEETTEGPGVSGRDVTLALGAGADRQECTGTTGSSGAVACTIPVVDQPLNADATVPVSLEFAGDTYYEPSTASATVLLEYYTGRAFGLSADVPLPLVGFEIEPTPDTGEIRTADGSSTDTPCLTELDLLLLQANALCPDVTTSLAPGTSVATASVDEVRIGIPGLPVIEVENATAQATSTCAGDGSATGTTEMTLRVGGEVIEIGTEPNTVVELPGVARIVVNEQVEDSDADHGLTVRALHLTALEGGVADVVVASATSGVHNCAS